MGSEVETEHPACINMDETVILVSLLCAGIGSFLIALSAFKVDKNKVWFLALVVGFLLVGGSIYALNYTGGF